jgi:hypothetical protein
MHPENDGTRVVIIDKLLSTTKKTPWHGVICMLIETLVMIG